MILNCDIIIIIIVISPLINCPISSCSWNDTIPFGEMKGSDKEDSELINSEKINRR